MRTALFLAVFAAVVGRDGCAPTDHDPCDGKRCGESCDPCAPGEPCPMTFAATACDPAGQCVTVGTFTCEPAADPCAGKLCGDDCVIDPPCAPLCAMPSYLGKCDPQGVCQKVTEMKCPPSPCAGKACGDACTTCDPMAGVCPMVMQYCDAQLVCGYVFPACP